MIIVGKANGEIKFWNSFALKVFRVERNDPSFGPDHLVGIFSYGLNSELMFVFSFIPHC